MFTFSAVIAPAHETVNSVEVVASPVGAAAKVSAPAAVADIPDGTTFTVTAVGAGPAVATVTGRIAPAFPCAFVVSIPAGTNAPAVPLFGRMKTSYAAFGAKLTMLTSTSSFHVPAVPAGHPVCSWTIFASRRGVSVDTGSIAPAVVQARLPAIGLTKVAAVVVVPARSTETVTLVVPKGIGGPPASGRAKTAAATPLSVCREGANLRRGRGGVRLGVDIEGGAGEDAEQQGILHEDEAGGAAGDDRAGRRGGADMADQRACREHNRGGIGTCLECSRHRLASRQTAPLLLRRRHLAALSSRVAASIVSCTYIIARIALIVSIRVAGPEAH